METRNTGYRQVVFLKQLSRKQQAVLLGIGLVIGVALTLLAAYVIVLQVRTPPVNGSIDPNRLNLTLFRDLGVHTDNEVHYTVHLVAKQWMYDIGQPRDMPAQITVPVNSTVTIVATSMDVNHSLTIASFPTLIIMPGHIAQATYTFSQPGIYPFVCSIYCGPKHENMHGEIIVVAPK